MISRMTGCMEDQGVRPPLSGAGVILVSHSFIPGRETKELEENTPGA